MNRESRQTRQPSRIWSQCPSFERSRERKRDTKCTRVDIYAYLEAPINLLANGRNVVALE